MPTLWFSLDDVFSSIFDHCMEAGFPLFEDREQDITCNLGEFCCNGREQFLGSQMSFPLEALLQGSEEVTGREVWGVWGVRELLQLQACCGVHCQGGLVRASVVPMEEESIEPCGWTRFTDCLIEPMEKPCKNC